MRKILLLTVALFIGTATIAQENTLRTTLKLKYVMAYIDQLYVDEVDLATLTEAGMLDMAYYVDSSKAEKLVKKYFKESEPTASIFKLYDALNASAPDSISRERMIEVGVNKMLYDLDPHTVYISAEDYKDMNAPLKGNFEGIGVRFQILKDTLMVVNPIPGGPSESIGIRAGDKIVYIDGENVAGVGIKNSGVRERLLGDKGTKVNVRIKRKGVDELLDFTITRDKIPIYSLDAAYMVTPEIGYIKLNNFSGSTMQEFKESMKELSDKGMKKLILDLQGNGGGYLGTAIDLADEFLSDQKMIVYTEGRAFPKREYHATALGGFENGNLVVLIDESSASASEIVTGAIQDWDRGLVIGRRSFGKGLVQRQIELPDTSAMRLTISRYYTPTGRSIQKPYDDGLEAYQLEKYKRYENGELTDASAIEFPDSLKYNTRVTKRTVYGGGGIMPDIFIPLDTLSSSKYFSDLIRKGHMNAFSLSYVDDNRKQLNKKFSTWEDFKAKFDPVKEGIVDELIAYAKEEGLEFDEEGYDRSKEIIAVRIKASMASDLYGSKKFYEIINELNDPLQKAITILENGDYGKMKLAASN